MQIVTALILCKGLYCLRHVPGTFKNGCSKLDVHMISSSFRQPFAHAQFASLKCGAETKSKKVQIFARAPRPCRNIFRRVRRARAKNLVWGRD